jgi:hypothetical protein
MRSLELIGFCTVAAGCGWATWKYFERDYYNARETGGPEWVRIERLTTWSVIGASVIGAIGISIVLIWLDAR